MRCKGSTILLACATFAGLAGSPAVADGGHTLQNARLTILFGSTANGYGTNDADRVDAISWVNSSGTAITNYVTSGGPLHCGDPQEFFGEAYGDYGTTGDTGVPTPNAVVPGVTSTWVGTGALKGTTKIGTFVGCDGPLDARTKTQYTLFTQPGLVNSLKIVRSLTFARHPSAGNIRAYVPRLPLGVYPVVYAPDASGVVQTYNANNCPLNCTETNWNGVWMADDDGQGNGMVVVRDPATNPPAQLTIDYDGYSNSNNSAVTLVMPTAGWSGTVVETEFLCFYDATSWPAHQRAKGKLPVGCTGIPH
jgi:hypothetical protein